jgi:FKBP-type peptidyl-prolyl cis-trans isomerase
MRLRSLIVNTLLLFIIGLFFNCSNPEQQKKNINPAEVSESLIKVNKELVKTEDQQIEDYISRYGWDMKTTGTGLRYMIYKMGTGSKAEEGKQVKLDYTISLLTGEQCYSSETDGYKEFVVGKGNVESGLEEGILFLKKGDRAKFILPSHLAFGLVGDRNKIPAKATLVYDIELLDLK